MTIWYRSDIWAKKNKTCVFKQLSPMTQMFVILQCKLFSYDWYFISALKYSLENYIISKCVLPIKNEHTCTHLWLSWMLCVNILVIGIKLLKFKNKLKVLYVDTWCVWKSTYVLAELSWFRQQRTDWTLLSRNNLSLGLQNIIESIFFNILHIRYTYINL